jgi:micrococcal nuclease
MFTEVHTLCASLFFMKNLVALLLFLLPVSTDLRPLLRVVDGDTIWVSQPDEKIRLIGIDAPETRNTGKKQVGYYGKEASDYLKARLKGKKVRLEYDVQRYDIYRRTLAYVYLEDGTMINAELVRLGYATVMTVAPNVKYADKFILLQQEARKKKRGLWAVSPY